MSISSWSPVPVRRRAWFAMPLSCLRSAPLPGMLVLCPGWCRRAQAQLGGGAGCREGGCWHSQWLHIQAQRHRKQRPRGPAQRASAPTRIKEFAPRQRCDECGRRTQPATGTGGSPASYAEPRPSAGAHHCATLPSRPLGLPWPPADAGHCHIADAESPCLQQHATHKLSTARPHSHSLSQSHGLRRARAPPQRPPLPPGLVT